jgi:3-oxoadipate enol-lactonase
MFFDRIFLSASPTRGMRQSGYNIQIKVQDIVVTYDDNGPAFAPAVIFIHGFPFSKSMWDRQADVLKSNFRIIAYDVRGHGGTEAGREEFSIDVFTEDLIHLMDALHVDKAVLCGISMGGYIALNAIEKFPERFIGLVLCSTQCFADTKETKEQRIKAIEKIKQDGKEAYANESIKKLFASSSLQTKSSEVETTREMIMQAFADSLKNTLFALAGRKETCSGLSGIKVPVMIIGGKEDPITPPAAHEFLRDHIKGAELYIIENAGHLVNMENTKAFNSYLRKYLGNLSRRLDRATGKLAHRF